MRAFGVDVADQLTGVDVEVGKVAQQRGVIGAARGFVEDLPGRGPDRSL